MVTDGGLNKKWILNGEKCTYLLIKHVSFKNIEFTPAAQLTLLSVMPVKLDVTK